MKQCSRCREWKDESAFTKRSDRDALKSHCRACKSNYDHSARNRNGSQRKRLLAEIVSMHGESCFYCEASDRLEIDHLLVPWRGGSEDILNMVPACRSCNASKGHRTPGEWLALRKSCNVHKVAPGGDIVSQCYIGGKRRSLNDGTGAIAA